MTTISLRPDTADSFVYQSVVEQNEYRIPEQLHPDDRIIDIGAHIGSFSYLCWQRGSRNIEAFEPHPENAELARHNLQGTGVVLHYKGVWRSDIEQPLTLYHSGFAVAAQFLYRPISLVANSQVSSGLADEEISPDGTNTGGGDIFAETGQPVETVSLDEVIGDKKVKILKIDCEGSEFPILLTCKRLSQVETIVGEYHILEKIPPKARIEGIEQYTPGVLADLLMSKRFRVEFIPNTRFDYVGNFFAYNLDAA